MTISRVHDAPPSPVLRGKRALAEYLGLSETFANNLLRDNTIPSFTQAVRARRGLVRFVLKADADAYLARLRGEALAVRDAERLTAVPG